MNAISPLGGLFIAGSIVLLATLILRLRRPTPERQLLLLGLLLRVAGSLGYLLLLESYYGGGDYLLYFGRGSQFADWIVEGDWGRVWSWVADGGRPWWGTRFVILVSGAVQVAVGQSIFAVFVVFGLIGYAGIVALWLAFVRAFPGLNSRGYLAWLTVFPSLWFWPSPLGKDALVLFGIGVAVFGFVGQRGKRSWTTLTAGTGLVLAVRPQVAAVLAASMIAGDWMGSINEWRIGRLAQGLILIAVGAGVIGLSSSAMGLDLLDPVEVGAYVDNRALDLAYGGSALKVSNEGVPLWMAPLNTFLRPFPWEARGLTVIIASAELIMLWILVWLRRREVVAFIAANRRDPHFWFALVFLLGYGFGIGLTLTNLGTLARQRVHLLPFLFIPLAWSRDSVSQDPTRPHLAVTGV